MKRPAIFTILLCIVGVVVGIGCAFAFKFVASSNTPTNTHDTTESNKTSPSYDESDERQTHNTFQDDIRDHLQALKQFEIRSQAKNFDEVEAAIYLYVAQIPDRFLGDIFESTTDSSFDSTTRILHKLQRALLERLTNIDPEEAVEYAVAHDLPLQLVTLSSHASIRLSLRFALPPSAPAQPSFITTVFYSWATRDLSAATEHAHTLDTESRQLALKGILESQSGKSLDELREIAVKLGSE